MAHLDPKEREEWDEMLTSPLVVDGRPAPPTQATVEAEGEAFMDLFAQVKGA